MKRYGDYRNPFAPPPGPKASTAICTLLVIGMVTVCFVTLIQRL